MTMEILNFVGGGRKLPPGFRFQPTDEEIVFQYLAHKIFSRPLPAQVIPEINNIFSFDPWELPGGDDPEQDRYFFTNKINSTSRIDRATCSGYWKPTGSNKRIICTSKRMPIIGIRKSLVFYEWRQNRSFETDWIMHEYCIVLSENASYCSGQDKLNSQGSLIRIGDWTLCRVFLKNRSSIAEVIDDSDNPMNKYDHDQFLTTDQDYMSDADSSSAPSSSPHDSSALNEVSSTLDDAEAKYSSRNI